MKENGLPNLGARVKEVIAKAIETRRVDDRMFEAMISRRLLGFAQNRKSTTIEEIVQAYRLKIAVDQVGAMLANNKELQPIATYVSFNRLRDWLYEAGTYKSRFDLDISDLANLSKLAEDDVVRIIHEFTRLIEFVKVDERLDPELVKQASRGEWVDPVLGIAVAPSAYYPICRVPAATHAAGSAVASFAVRVLARHIGYLRNQFDVRGQEILREDQFIRERLDEYLWHLSKPRGVLLTMTDVQRTTGHHVGQSLLTMTTRTLPQGVVLYEGILDVRKALEKEIVSQMKRLRRSVLAEEREMEEKRRQMASAGGKEQTQFLREMQEWELSKNHRIGLMFSEKGRALLELRDKCQTILEHAGSFVEVMKHNWDLDMKELRKEKKCRPSGEQECPIPF